MNSFHPWPSLARRRGNTLPHRRRHESTLRRGAGQSIRALREGWGNQIGSQSKKNSSLASLKKGTSSPPDASRRIFSVRGSRRISPANAVRPSALSGTSSARQPGGLRRRAQLQRRQVGRGRREPRDRRGADRPLLSRRVLRRDVGAVGGRGWRHLQRLAVVDRGRVPLHAHLVEHGGGVGRISACRGRRATHITTCRRRRRRRRSSSRAAARPSRSLAGPRRRSPRGRSR